MPPHELAGVRGRGEGLQRRDVQELRVARRGAGLPQAEGRAHGRLDRQEPRQDQQAQSRGGGGCAASCYCSSRARGVSSLFLSLSLFRSLSLSLLRSLSLSLSLLFSVSLLLSLALLLLLSLSLVLPRSCYLLLEPPLSTLLCTLTPVAALSLWLGAHAARHVYGACVRHVYGTCVRGASMRTRRVYEASPSLKTVDPTLGSIIMSHEPSGSLKNVDPKSGSYRGG